MNYTIRALTVADIDIVWQMLLHAAHEPSLEAVKKQPSVARYALDWGRAGDRGYAATNDTEVLGAAWLRLWTGTDKGFGYISDEIPELAIAVLPDYRGQGIGTELLTRILQTAKDHYPAISLSTRSDNPAARLYERMGFTKVPESNSVNRTGGTSFNMIYWFNR